eukprot:m.340594 g.340594  ORF g.340594 m.340594 type:complete len:278 (+) comp19402_c0_seq1:268-1101(+)
MFSCTFLLLVLTCVFNSVYGECWIQPDENGHVDIPENFTEIPDRAFYKCTLLVSINIPHSVTTISSHAFYETGLLSVDLPKVKTIGKSAFRLCLNLVSANLPEVETLAPSAFDVCRSLVSINLAQVKTIGYFAFRSCWSLVSVDFPTVTKIGAYSFAGCGKLKRVFVPGSLETFEMSAFQGCKALTDVYIEEGVKTIGRAVFLASGLRNVYIPRGVTIKHKAFDEIRCNISGLIAGKKPKSVLNCTSVDYETFQRYWFNITTPPCKCNEKHGGRPYA